VTLANVYQMSLVKERPCDADEALSGICDRKQQKETMKIWALWSLPGAAMPIVLREYTGGAGEVCSKNAFYSFCPFSLSYLSLNWTS
jgi:hypothetical protein